MFKWFAPKKPTPVYSELALKVKKILDNVEVEDVEMTELSNIVYLKSHNLTIWFAGISNPYIRVGHNSGGEAYFYGDDYGLLNWPLFDLINSLNQFKQRKKQEEDSKATEKLAKTLSYVELP